MAQHPKLQPLVTRLENQYKPMSLKPEQFSSVAASAPEPVGAAVGKITIAWTGLFAGMTLGDWALLAALVYTLLQITVLTVEHIIQPFMKMLEARRARKLAESNSQEK